MVGVLGKEFEDRTFAHVVPLPGGPLSHRTPPPQPPHHIT